MEPVALTLARLPRYLVLDPVATVRFEVRLSRPSAEIDVELGSPQPGRSFLLLLGPQGGPVLQRLRVTGRARLVFRANDDRTHVLMFANPQKEPLVLKLRGRAGPVPARPPRDAPVVGPPAVASRRVVASRRRKARPAEPSGVAGLVVADARAGSVDLPARRARPKG